MNLSEHLRQLEEEIKSTLQKDDVKEGLRIEFPDGSCESSSRTDKGCPPERNRRTKGRSPKEFKDKSPEEFPDTNDHEEEHEMSPRSKDALDKKMSEETQHVGDRGGIDGMRDMLSTIRLKEFYDENCDDADKETNDNGEGWKDTDAGDVSIKFGEDPTDKPKKADDDGWEGIGKSFKNMLRTF
jgi:hypothetical protein